MQDKQGRESGPTLTFRPSSSNDRRHNNLLPAATHCNNLCRTLEEATNAEKSIVQHLTGRTFSCSPSLYLQNTTGGGKIYCVSWSENCFLVFFIYCIFHLGTFCLQRLLGSCRPRLLHCGMRLCLGNDSWQEWWKAAGTERSWATKIWSNIYIRAVFERPQWHSRLTVRFWAAGPMWRLKTIHTQHKSVWRT